VTGISASVGVIASGLITDSAGWRWVFLINVPIGVLLIATAASFLPVDARDHRGERFDAAGAVTATAGLLLLVYALNRGADHGWGSGSTLGLFAASVVLLAAFVLVEARSGSSLVPVSAVRNRTLVAANVSAFFTFAALFSFIFLGSLLMQQVLAYSPTRTGVAWLATTAMSFVAAAITGAKLVAVVGVRRLLIAGNSLLAIAVLLLTRIPAGGHYATDLLPALLLAGVAGGLAAPAAQIAALSGVTHSMTGLASGLIETMREIGGGRRHRRGRGGDRARLAGRRDHRRHRPSGPHTHGSRCLPRRLLGDLRHRSPGRTGRRDHLPTTRNPSDRTGVDTGH
jgi:predicted MFS family arabinose efflux permease